MSCRFSVSRSGGARAADLLGGADAAELFQDLADAGRGEDFRWFALSQGVPPERVEELWRYLYASRRASRARDA